MKGFVAAYKSGRAFNGAHRDSGTIIHLVPSLPEITSKAGFWGDKSLCGVKPGRRGNGWAETNQEVNCEKCISKNNNTMANQIALAEQQLTGYKHGKDGYTLIQLIESMGLTKKEWKKLQKDYDPKYLTDEEITEIDNFFENAKK